MAKFLSWIKKALYAAAAAGAATFVGVYPDGVTNDEWLKVILAIVAGGVGVFLLRNRPTPN